MFIPHKPGDPMDFSSYQGQSTIKRRLGLRLNAMQRGEGIRALFYAPAGQGKTALVRVLAKELADRNLADEYIETIAGRFETKADLDTFMRQLKPYTIVFIDEIHGLPGQVRDALYPAIQDGVYAYNDKQSIVPLPVGLHWIGATTDLGKVHPALQRRLLPIPLEPLSFEDRVWIAGMLPRRVDLSAAREMAKRCWSPWEIKDELYATAADVATEQQSNDIELTHVTEACRVLDIDENGLRPVDRRILECLYKSVKIVRGDRVFAMAKNPLVVMAGIDDATYTNAIEPKLLRLQYITVRAGVGRTLTDKAIQEYFEHDH